LVKTINFGIQYLKEFKMISNYTVLTVPQWAIFAAITVMAYGWVEKKWIFGIIGSGILVALGVFAAIAIYAGWMMPESMLEISENLTVDELFTPDELPIEGRLLPFYWVLVINGLIALAAMLGEIYHKRFGIVLKVVAGALSIIIFFLMMAAVRA
jgi:hypothetical protein